MRRLSIVIALVVGVIVLISVNVLWVWMQRDIESGMEEMVEDYQRMSDEEIVADLRERSERAGLEIAVEESRAREPAPVASSTVESDGTDSTLTLLWIALAAVVGLTVSAVVAAGVMLRPREAAQEPPPQA